jgi:hypothetical protein
MLSGFERQPAGEPESQSSAGEIQDFGDSDLRCVQHVAVLTEQFVLAGRLSPLADSRLDPIARRSISADAQRLRTSDGLQSAHASQPPAGGFPAPEKGYPCLDACIASAEQLSNDRQGRPTPSPAPGCPLKWSTTKELHSP